MASGLQQFNDESGAQQVFGGITGTGLEFGNGTPTAGYTSIDGTVFALGANFVGGVAQPPSQLRASGSTSIVASTVSTAATTSISISLARNPIVICTGNANQTGIYSYSSTSIVLANYYNGGSNTVTYVYI